MKETISNILLNRLIIALASAAGAYILAAWPAVHGQLCTVGGL